MSRAPALLGTEPRGLQGPPTNAVPRTRMTAPDRPQLRPYLAAVPQDREGYHFVVWDQLRLSDRQLRLTGLELTWLQLFDGRRTLHDIPAEAARQAGGQFLPV